MGTRVKKTDSDAYRDLSSMEWGDIADEDNKKRAMKLALQAFNDITGLGLSEEDVVEPSPTRLSYLASVAAKSQFDAGRTQLFEPSDFDVEEEESIRVALAGYRDAQSSRSKVDLEAIRNDQKTVNEILHSLCSLKDLAAASRAGTLSSRATALREQGREIDCIKCLQNTCERIQTKLAKAETSRVEGRKAGGRLTTTESRRAFLCRILAVQVSQDETKLRQAREWPSEGVLEFRIPTIASPRLRGLGKYEELVELVLKYRKTNYRSTLPFITQETAALLYIVADVSLDTPPKVSTKRQEKIDEVPPEERNLLSRYVEAVKTDWEAIRGSLQNGDDDTTKADNIGNAVHTRLKKLL